MSAMTPERPEGTENTKQPSEREKELKEAVERVYRKYGTNLTAFYRDAYRESQREAVKGER